MASKDPLDNLQSEVSCSICLDYFTDPVITQCGHNFCRPCITACWEGQESHFSCPQCRAVSRQRSILPNRQLGSVADWSKRMSLKRKEREEELCEAHDEPLKLYCLQDQKALCLVCLRSRDHGSCPVIPVEEAARDYKGKLQDWLPSLRRDLESVKEHKRKEEEKSNTITEKLASHRDDILSSFTELHNFIEQEKQCRLRSLENAQERHQIMCQGKLSQLDTQQLSLTNLLVEIEGKCLEQDVELLKDVSSVLNRCENMKIPKPEDDPAEVEKILKSLSTDRAKLQEKIVAIEGIFPTEKARRYFNKFKVAVTLDPDTLNEWLNLSEDRRSVQDGNSFQKLPDHPKRFIDADRCVLGSEGFTTGKHYWEVLLLQDGRGWYIGAATESDRKQGAIYSPEGGIWAVSQYNSQYGALTSPLSTLSLRENPLKVGVFLDCEKGLLILVNAATMEHLYVFKNLPLTQRIFPFFSLWEGAELSLL